MSAAKKAKDKPEAEKADAGGAKPGKKGGDLAGRFGAWWNGVDYVPPAADGETPANDTKKPAKAQAAKPEAVKAEAAPEPKAVEATPEAETKPEPAPAPAGNEIADAAAAKSGADCASVRVKALETLWGEGRLSPGSADIDAKLLDAALDNADELGGIGFIAADAALLNAFAARSERSAQVAEWRTGCIDRVRQLAKKASVEACDLDRPRAFGEGVLDALVSLEAFAFADHKNGLVARAHRALNANGRWVILETTRNTARTPAEAFASAWAEPQLATADDIDEMLQLSGFASVHKISVTDLVLDAARKGYQQLASMLEQAATMAGRESALFLQELSWEAQSWRARVRALEGGALEVNLWIADKQAPLELTQVSREALSDEVLETAVNPDDAGASDALFEPAQEPETAGAQ